MKKNKKINVVHCKRDNYDFLITRPSKWGNPFIIGVHGTRKEVIEKYRQYILDTPELFNSLPELKGLTLGCWCKPDACHGDVLVELYNMYFNTNSILNY